MGGLSSLSRSVRKAGRQLSGGAKTATKQVIRGGKAVVSGGLSEKRLADVEAERLGRREEAAVRTAEDERKKSVLSGQLRLRRKKGFRQTLLGGSSLAGNSIARPSLVAG